jgi:uncharacterized protein (DUF1684 family)
MPAKEHLEGQWREWRHARVAELTRPYGWTALVAQHWLRDGDDGLVLEGLPGTWGVADGKVVFTPPAEGPNLVVDGEHPTSPVEIVPGRNQTYGHGRSVPVYFGVSEVETIPRTTDDGDRIFAVRVRDPRESARKDFSGLAAYEYDPSWRVPAHFTPALREDVEQITVETGVRETTARIGTLSFEYDGRSYELALIGKDAAYGVQPVAHIRDLTSGKTTYGAGRVVELQFADESGERIDHIDFNYLTALPCAFTNFVTCPLPPSQNHLDFEVLAGEKKPDVDIDRVLTFQST